MTDCTPTKPAVRPPTLGERLEQADALFHTPSASPLAAGGPDLYEIWKNALGAILDPIDAAIASGRCATVIVRPDDNAEREQTVTIGTRGSVSDCRSLFYAPAAGVRLCPERLDLFGVVRVLDSPAP